MAKGAHCAAPPRGPARRHPRDVYARAPGSRRARHGDSVSFQDLREFIQLLEDRGQLRRIEAPVKRELEITEIADRVVKGPKAQNHALLFEHVEGAAMPVLINAFGSEERMAWALGVERLDELGAKIKGLLDLKMPGSLIDKMKKGLELLDVARAGPKRVKSGPCQEVVETDRPSLAALPILRCWPGDAGHYITLPLVFTRDPVTGRRNVGMYRLQVYDDRTLGLHWQTHKGGAEHEREARRTGKERMPVAIALGGDPATIYSGLGAAAARARRDAVRRLAARQGRRDGAVPDDRPRGAGRGRDRARGLRAIRRSRASRGRSATTPATTPSRTTIRSST